MLKNLFSTDAGLVAFGFVTIRDIFALAFVSADVRGSVTGLTHKWKYIRARAKAGLAAHIGNREFIYDMLDAGRGFVSGSQALAIILDAPWQSGDIDLYFPNKTGCALASAHIPRDIYKVHTAINDPANPYAINRYVTTWFDAARGSHEIDVLDANIAGPDDFDMTMVQNWLWADGRLRARPVGRCPSRATLY